MGLARSHGERNNLGRRLATLAAPLEPARPPFYVSQPDRRTPSPGWWWTPAGLARPVYLGHNHIVAENALRALLDAQELPHD